MPEADYLWLPREDLLSFEEVGRLVDVFAAEGTDRIRLTGGEPLVRRDIASLVEQITARPTVTDVALTTNGVLLASRADALRRAGLHRLTVSLDTLRPDRFTALTRFDAHREVLRGIDAAQAAGFDQIKLDTVVIRGVNDDELIDLLEFGKQRRIEVRFIEYMDVGGATQWSMASVVSRRAMLEAITRHYGAPVDVPATDVAPADRYALPDGTVFGVISSTTQPFCHSCDRSRLTADGQWLLCLYARDGIDLRTPLRQGESADAIRARIRDAWSSRQDRGAEVRLQETQRAPLVGVEDLRRNAHLEMHTRGG